VHDVLGWLTPWAVVKRFAEEVVGPRAHDMDEKEMMDPVGQARRKTWCA
jgi:hypothetical protein